MKWTKIWFHFRCNGHRILNSYGRLVFKQNDNNEWRDEDFFYLISNIIEMTFCALWQWIMVRAIWPLERTTIIFYFGIQMGCRKETRRLIKISKRALLCKQNKTKQNDHLLSSSVLNHYRWHSFVFAIRVYFTKYILKANSILIAFNLIAVEQSQRSKFTNSRNTRREMRVCVLAKPNKFRVWRLLFINYRIIRNLGQCEECTTNSPDSSTVCDLQYPVRYWVFFLVELEPNFFQFEIYYLYDGSVVILILILPVLQRVSQLL